MRSLLVRVLPGNSSTSVTGGERTYLRSCLVKNQSCNLGFFILDEFDLTIERLEEEAIFGFESLPGAFAGLDSNRISDGCWTMWSGGQSGLYSSRVEKFVPIVHSAVGITFGKGRFIVTVNGTSKVDIDRVARSLIRQISN
jgi:hypothetical protein